MAESNTGTASSTNARPCSDIRGRARSALMGHIGVTISATLLYMLIYFIAVSLCTPSPDSPYYLAVVEISSLVIRFLEGLFASGGAFLYLNIAYQDKASISDYFHAFKEQPSKSILVQGVFVAIYLLSEVPLIIYQAAFSAGASASYVGTVLFLVLSWLLSFLLSLPFSQAFYVLQDFPARSVKELLKGSINLMRGNYWRYIRLCLSFLPLAILGGVSLFIPLLWVKSYYETAKAVFYKDLAASPHGTGNASGGNAPGFGNEAGFGNAQTSDTSDSSYGRMA